MDNQRYKLLMEIFAYLITYQKCAYQTAFWNYHN
jgi:hypothetical protein